VVVVVVVVVVAVVVAFPLNNPTIMVLLLHLTGMVVDPLPSNMEEGHPMEHQPINNQLCSHTNPLFSLPFSHLPHQANR